MGHYESFEHKALLTAEFGYEAADLTILLREQAERAIYDALKADLLCKVPGAVTRFAECNSKQLGDIAAIVMRHWDDTAAAGRLVRQQFNTWIWQAAEEEAALG